MHLKSLALKGFKSFADRSVMTFEPGITAIVGPNGSGKSNVSDAVLWVLGERNARNLRGQAMEDVIFSGSSARKPVSMAEVTLVLDNSDGTLPVEYGEVSLSRRMYRNGESEYLINGSQARRMDVLDILHDSGLGTGTHSIIGQGQLSSILQSRPEDRRTLIEEAAGVLKHKQRKEKSIRKLALMDDHLTRVRDIVSEVQRQLKPLERKAKKTLAYRDASEELATIELDLAVDDLRILHAQWDGILKEEIAADQSVVDLRAQIELKEKEAQELQAALQQFTAGAGQSSARYRRAQGIADKIDSGILLFHEKKRSSTAYLAEMRISLENDLRASEAALAQKESAKTSFEESQKANEIAQETRKLAQDRADEARAKQRDLQKEIDKLSHLRRDAQSDLEDVRAILAKTQEILASNRAQSQVIDTHVQDLDARLHDASDVSFKASSQVEEAQAALDRALVHEAEIRQESGKALRVRDEARNACDKARGDRASNEARVKALEELQRTRRAQNPLLSWLTANQEECNAIPLVQLVSVPENLEPLVVQLLGGDAEALFIDDGESAMSLIRDALSISDHGSFSLMPKKISHSRKKMQGPRRLIDLIAYDDSVCDALERILGNVFLFDDAMEAFSFASQNEGTTCATEEGFVVWASGRISCYRPRKDEASNFSDYRELEQAKKDLHCSISAEEKAEAEAQQREHDLRVVQTQGLEASQQVAQLKGMLQSASSEKKRAEALLKSLHDEKKRLESQRKQVAAALAQAEPNARVYEDKVVALVEEAESLKNTIDQKRGEIAPLRVLADKAASDLADAKLAAVTCAERLAYSKRMLEACDRDMSKAQERINRVRDGITKKESALGQIDPMIDVLSALSKAIQSFVSRLEQEAFQLQNQTDSMHGAINDIRSLIRVAHEHYDSQVQLLADVRVRKSRIEMQVESAVSTITKDCKTPLETALDLPQIQDRGIIEERAHALRRKIANMGTVNPDAAAEYEQLKARHDYLSSQMDDVLVARRSLNRIVSAIDARMRDDFARTFNEVNDNFRMVFSQLFPEGRGSLSLVDPDNLEETGVEVSAQPPGKRILKMSLMSGGEKSLTALALLFAIYKTRTTPFYILDEVEAALDDTNLRRLLAYLETIKDNSQFIIITHQRRTMEMANVLYGISMQSDGVTKVMSQRLDKALRYAEG